MSELLTGSTRHHTIRPDGGLYSDGMSVCEAVNCMWNTYRLPIDSNRDQKLSRVCIDLDGL